MAVLKIQIDPIKDKKVLKALIALIEAFDLEYSLNDDEVLEVKKN